MIPKSATGSRQSGSGGGGRANRAAGPLRAAGGAGDRRFWAKSTIPGMEIDIAVRKYSVPYVFSDACIAQAQDALPDKVRSTGQEAPG
jgi:hypothetical protein